MITISKKEIMDRWDSMPDELKETIWSEYNAEILWNKCKEEHLSEEKTDVVATLAGDVIMGFLLLDDLGKEIAKELEINKEIANAIADEIDRKIFEPVKGHIRKIYSPPRERVPVDAIKKPSVPEKTISLEKLGPMAAAPLEKIEIKIEKTVSTPKPMPLAPTKPSEIKPFILHEEKSFGAAQDKPKAPGRTFSFPFRIFPARPEPGRRAEPPQPVKARVEEPESSSVKAAAGKRVVHYSELRTPLPPVEEKPASTRKDYADKEEIINLESFDSQPKLDGNVIDLKKNG